MDKETREGSATESQNAGESRTEDNLLASILAAAGHDVDLPEDTEDNEPHAGNRDDSGAGDDADNGTQDKDKEEGEKEGQERDQDKDKEAGKDKRPYTAEELIELGKSESIEKIDTARIPPEMQAIYKSFQAMATRRQQVIAEKERELEQRLAQMQQQGTQQTGTQQQGQVPQTPLPQLVYQNPVEALNQLHARLDEVDQKLREASANDNIFEAQQLLIEKDDLRSQVQGVENLISTVRSEWAEMFRAIPDLQTKRDALREFVMSIATDDPFTDEELNTLTNPLIVGRTATRFVKLINTLYDQKVKAEADLRAVEEKLKKATPKPVERPGSGDKSKVVKTKSREILKKAQETGDILDMAEYIASLSGEQSKE